jgi:hypothetical protein
MYSHTTLLANAATSKKAKPHERSSAVAGD